MNNLYNYIANEIPVLLTYKAYDLYLNGYVVKDDVKYVEKNIVKDNKKKTILESDIFAIFGSKEKMIEQLADELIKTNHEITKERNGKSLNTITLLSPRLIILYEKDKKKFYNKIIKITLKSKLTTDQLQMIDEYISTL